MREVEHGITFCLSLPLDYPGGNTLFKYRREKPVLHYIKREKNGVFNFNYELSQEHAPFSGGGICDDSVTLFTHYSTQWDALAHLGQMFDADGDGVAEKVFYNGYRAGVELVGPNPTPPTASARESDGNRKLCDGRGTRTRSTG